jgi:hypothetical protein
MIATDFIQFREKLNQVVILSRTLAIRAENWELNQGRLLRSFARQNETGLRLLILSQPQKFQNGTVRQRRALRASFRAPA